MAIKAIDIDLKAILDVEIEGKDALIEKLEQDILDLKYELYTKENERGSARKNINEALTLLDLGLHAHKKEKYHIMEDHADRAIDYIKAAKKKL